MHDFIPLMLPEVTRSPPEMLKMIREAVSQGQKDDRRGRNDDQCLPERGPQVAASLAYLQLPVTLVSRAFVHCQMAPLACSLLPHARRRNTVTHKIQWTQCLSYFPVGSSIHRNALFTNNQEKKISLVSSHSFVIGKHINTYYWKQSSLIFTRAKAYRLQQYTHTCCNYFECTYTWLCCSHTCYFLHLFTTNAVF